MIRIRKEVIDKFAALITAALGLVAALAWNGAIQSIFKRIFGDQDSISAMVSYALIVTIIAVLATLWVGRAAEKANKLAELAEKTTLKAAEKAALKVAEKVPKLK